MNAINMNLKLQEYEATPSLPGAFLEVRQVVDISEIKTLKEEWLELEQSNPNTVLFQSWHWCNNFIEFAFDNEALSPIIFTVRKFGELIAVLPLCIQTEKTVKILTGLTEPYQQYTDLLVSKNVDLKEIGKALFAEFKNVDVDYLHFGQVRSESALNSILDGNAKIAGERDAAPFVQLTDWDDFESYHKSVKKKTRKNMRNARNRLEKTGALSHVSADGGELLHSVIDRAYEGREAWLERLGITSRAFRRTDFREFLERFKKPENTGVDVLAMAMSHGDKPMSDQWGFVYRGRYYAFMATWHEDYEASSPGKLHLCEVIETCYERGVDAADFMLPRSKYKMTWSANAAPVCDYVFPLSKKGWVFTNVWLDFLRPLAKKVLQAMPSGLRSTVMGVLIGLLRRGK